MIDAAGKCSAKSLGKAFDQSWIDGQRFGIQKKKLVVLLIKLIGKYNAHKLITVMPQQNVIQIYLRIAVYQPRYRMNLWIFHSIAVHRLIAFAFTAWNIKMLSSCSDANKSNAKKKNWINWRTHTHTQSGVCRDVKIGKRNKQTNLGKQTIKWSENHGWYSRAQRWI